MGVPKQDPYKEANKAGSKGMRKLVMGVVTKASTTLLSPDKNDLSDEIKSFFDTTELNKDIVIDHLLQGIATLYSINFDGIFNKKAGFALVFDPITIGKKTISLLTEDGLPTDQQKSDREKYIDNVVKPFQSVMRDITKSNIVLERSERLIEKIKNFIFSIFHDESKSLKMRTENLIRVVEITRKSLNAYVTDDPKMKASQDKINAISDKLYEIRDKMAENLPVNYGLALEKICHELANAIENNLVPFDIKEKQSIFQQIFSNLKALFLGPKLSDDQLAKKLILSDPILKEKITLLKAKNQAIKAEKTEKEPEITSEQINNVKP